MRLVADEHVTPRYVEALRNDGHRVDRVVDVPELGPSTSDAAIAEHAREIGAPVVTNDVKDFDRFDDHPGVIVVPQHGLTAGEVAAAVRRMERTLETFEDRTLFATTWG